MNPTLRHSVDISSVSDIEAHLAAVDSAFLAGLSRRVLLDEYVQKIASQSTRIEAWDGQNLVGLVALYANDAKSRVAFVTHVSVNLSRQRSGLARVLLTEAMSLAAQRGMSRLELEVEATNVAARNLYKSLGLADINGEGTVFVMGKVLSRELEH